MRRPIDYTPLLAPVSREEVRAYRRQVRAAESPALAVGRAFAIGCGGLVAAVVLGTLIVSFASLGLQSTLSEPANPIGWIYTAVPILVVAVVVLGVVLAVLSTAAGNTWEKGLRMSRFAAVNGLVYARRSNAPNYPGAIFGLGHARSVTDHLRALEGRFIDMGNFNYKTGSGDNQVTHRWGFLAVHLDRRLPHMVLDATANNGLFGASNLPSSFSRDQRLSLEGDFDRYFTLYCPREYERDALYVFTPDLMALLIDNAAPYDVEIVDDWMFVYSAQPFRIADPAVYERLFRIVDTVGDKTLRQTDRYVDERVGTFAANTVAPQGRRLRRSVSIGTVAIVVAVLSFWVWGLLQDLVS